MLTVLPFFCEIESVRRNVNEFFRSIGVMWSWKMQKCRECICCREQKLIKNVFEKAPREK